MIHWNATPCRINGKLYPSQVQAAYDLGVTPNAISQAIRHGREDRVAKGLGRLGNKNAGRRVSLFGMSFPSRKDAAAALGLSRTKFQRLLDAGTPEAMQSLLAAKMRVDAQQRGAR